MSMEQVMSLVRQILTFAGGFVVSLGFFDSDTMLQVVGAVSTLIGAGWAFWARSKKQLVSAAAAIVPITFNAQSSVGIEDKIDVTK